MVLQRMAKLALEEKMENKIKLLVLKEIQTIPKLRAIKVNNVKHDATENDDKNEESKRKHVESVKTLTKSNAKYVQKLICECMN